MGRVSFGQVEIWDIRAAQNEEGGERNNPNNVHTCE
jgi:hypothetical protein